jgi:hypothetical protein
VLRDPRMHTLRDHSVACNNDFRRLELLQQCAIVAIKRGAQDEIRTRGTAAREPACYISKERSLPSSE